MVARPSFRRAITAATAAVVALGVTPLVGTAFAAGEPTLVSTSPAANAYVQTASPSTTISAMYDMPLDATSTISVLDGSKQTPAGSVTRTASTITYTAVPQLAEGKWDVTVIAKSGADSTRQTETKFSFWVDNTAPNSTVSIVPDVINTDNVGVVAVTGNADPGSALTLTAEDEAIADAAVDTTPTVRNDPITVPASGEYTASMDVSTLSDGVITVSSSATDQAGNDETVPGSATAPKDTVAPAGTTVVFADEDKTINKTGAPAVRVTGVAEKQASVQLVISSDAAGSATVTETVRTGNDCAPCEYAHVFDLAAAGVKDGKLTATATAIDDARNQAAAVTDTGTLDTQAPPLTVAAPPITSANVGNVVVAGTTDKGLPVRVTLKNPATDTSPEVILPAQTDVAGDDGTYSVTFNAAALNDGRVVASATTQDGAGNPATEATHESFKDVKPPTDPATSVDLPEYVRRIMTIRGDAEARSKVTVTINDDPNDPQGRLSAPVTATATANDVGRYEAKDVPLTDLVDGVLTVTAKATDAAGNTDEGTTPQTTIKDTVAPDAPGVTGVPAAANIENVHKVPISGTRVAGTAVTVTVTDSSVPPASVSTTVDAAQDTAWATWMNLTGLAEGALTVTAVATDRAGNESAASEPKSTIKDTIRPAPPVIDAVPVVNGANKSSVPISGSRERGSKVDLVLTDSSAPAGTKTAQVVAGDSATWATSVDTTAPELAQGSIVVTATVTDAAGNTSLVSEAVQTRKDTVAPQAPVVVGLDSLINAKEAAAYFVEVTSNELGSVSVSVDDGATGVLTDRITGSDSDVDGDRTFRVGPLDLSTLGDGDLTFTATATDAAGNTGSSTTPNPLPVKDAAAPAKPEITTAPNVDRSNVAAATVTGTAEKAATVVVSADDSAAATSPVINTVRADASSGAYTATLDLTSDGVLPLLVDGDLIYRLTATDVAGNVSEAATATKSHNTTALTLREEDSTPTAGSKVRAAPSIELTFTEPIERAAAPVTVTNKNATVLAGIISFEDGDTTVVFQPENVLDELGSPYTVAYDVREARPNVGTEDTARGSYVFEIDPLRQNPPTVTLTNPVTSKNDLAGAVSGTAESAGSTMSISVDDAGDAGTPAVTATTTAATVADATGRFPYSVTGLDLSKLKDGTLTASVTATEKDPGTGTDITSSAGTATALKDATGPVGTTLTKPAVITQANQEAFEVTGTAVPGSTLSGVLTRGDATAEASDTTAGSDGTYVLRFGASQLPESSADEDVTARVVASDFYGNRSQPVTATTTKDATGPTISNPDVTSPVTSANHNAVDVSGNTEPGRPVTVTISDGTTAVSAPETSGSLVDGAFTTMPMDVRSLANDLLLTVSMLSTDVRGNSKTTTMTTYKDALAPAGTTVVLPAVNADNHRKLQVTGVGEPGSTVRITISDAESATDLPATDDVVATAVVGAAAAGSSLGSYKTPEMDVSALRETRLTAVASAADGYGNTAPDVESSATKDTLSPSISTASVPMWVNATNVSSAPVSGTVTGGAYAVTVTVDDGDATTPARTAEDTTVGDGTFAVLLDLTTLKDTRDNGLVTTVTVRDEYGNRAETTRTSTKDVVAPAVSGLAATATNRSNTTSTVSGATEKLSTVTVFMSDGKSTASGSGSSDANGTFSFPVEVRTLTDGRLAVTATATDRAGNVGPGSDEAYAQKDTRPPALTTVTIPTVNKANVTAVPVTGTADPGSRVAISIADTEPPLTSGPSEPTADVTAVATAQPDGTYKVATPPDLSSLRDGALTATATETDAAGNVGAPVTTTSTKDTVAPAAVTASMPAVITPRNQADVPVTGAAEPGSTVRVVADDTDAQTAPVAKQSVAAADGNFRLGLDLTSLAQGGLQIQVIATDGAGNAADTVRLQSLKDTVGAVITELLFTGPVTAANSSDTKASGRTEPGAAVTVTVTDAAGRAASGTSTAASDGAFVVAVPVASLSDGVLTVTARATDAHGTTGSPRTTTVEKRTTSTDTGTGGGTGGGGGGSGGGTSPTPTPTATATPTESASPAPTGSASPAPTDTPSPEPSQTLAPLSGSGFVALASPVRVMDSRKGVGTTTGVKLGAVTVDLSRQIPSGATGAVLNVTVTGTTGTGHVVVYPAGNAMPRTSNVNFARSQTQANEVVVGLPASRGAVVHVAGASTHVITDVVGYFTADGDPDTLGRVITRAPLRVLDSRPAPLNVGTSPQRKLGEVVVDLRGKVPAGTTAVALNVTVAGPAGAGHVVAYPTGTQRPGTSNVNFAKGQTQANEVVTRLGTGAHAGKVTLFVAGGSVDLIADLVASVVPGSTAGGQLFNALEEPARVMDSRKGTGTSVGRKNGELFLSLPADVVPADATGVVLNVTTTGATKPGYVTVYQAGAPAPRTSNVNFRPGATQANEVLTAVNGGRQVAIKIAGVTHVIVDVVGYLVEG